MKTIQDMRFEAALNFLIHRFTYQNKDHAIQESIEMADKLIDALQDDYPKEDDLLVINAKSGVEIE